MLCEELACIFSSSAIYPEILFVCSIYLKSKDDFCMLSSTQNPLNNPSSLRGVKANLDLFESELPNKQRVGNTSFNHASTEKVSINLMTSEMFFSDLNDAYNLQKKNAIFKNFDSFRLYSRLYRSIFMIFLKLSYLSNKNRSSRYLLNFFAQVALNRKNRTLSK